MFKLIAEFSQIDFPERFQKLLFLILLVDTFNIPLPKVSKKDKMLHDYLQLSPKDDEHQSLHGSLNSCPLIIKNFPTISGRNMKFFALHHNFKTN